MQRGEGLLSGRAVMEGLVAGCVRLGAGLAELVEVCSGGACCGSCVNAVAPRADSLAHRMPPLDFM